MRETIIRTEQEQKGRRIMRDNSNGQKINFNIIKNEKGITLVALVITIIIIIILATVAINFAFGNNGLIRRAEDARDYYANDTKYTDESMANVESYLDELINGKKVEPTKVYAKLYTYKDGSGDVLELSSNENFEDISEELTFKESYGDISGNHYYVDEETFTMFLPPWLDEAAEYMNDTIKTVKIVDEIAPVYTSCWFAGLPALEKIENIERLKTENTLDMSMMFSGCVALTELDVSGFDTSNVTNMSGMFASTGLTELDVSGFDTSNVINMSDMFHTCRSLTKLDVSGFDTSNVTDMSEMFGFCEGLTELDVSGFDTSNVTDMNNMFLMCTGLTKLDLSSFKTINVTNMETMFSNCSSLTELDVSGFDTSNVINMSAMFHNCRSLTKLDVSNFNTSNVIDMPNMFQSCENLTELDVSNFNTSNVINMPGMFQFCENLTELDVSGFDTSNVTNMMGLFGDCPNLTTIYVGANWRVSQEEAQDFMIFDGCGTDHVTTKPTA